MPETWVVRDVSWKFPYPIHSTSVTKILMFVVRGVEGAMVLKKVVDRAGPVVDGVF